MGGEGRASGEAERAAPPPRPDRTGTGRRALTARVRAARAPEDGSEPGPPRAARPGRLAALSPWWILPVFGAAALAALGGAPAAATAAGLGLALVALLAWDPALGVAAVVLASGGLLGEYKTPYFLLGHALALATILSALAHRAPGAGAPARASLWPVGLVVLVAVLALPLDLRTLLEELWLGRWLDWRGVVARGLPDQAPLKPLERIGVLALGAGLFAVAARCAPSRAAAGVVQPLAAIVGALGALGLLRFFGVVRTSGQYLTLSFWTWAHPDLRLTGVAWNPDYFAQFLTLTVPVVLTLVWRPGAAAPRLLGAVAAALGALALVFTFQRAAYAALVVALGTLVLLRRRGGASRPHGGWAPIVGAGLGVVLAVAAIDRLLVGGRVAGRLARFATDPNRVTLWEAALGMFAAHPILGVGTGRYAYFFREYADPRAVVGFGPFWGTAHSTYLQLLAEQGALGLLAFVLCFGRPWLRALRGRAGLEADRRLVVDGLVASLAGWFVYAAVQYVFRVDALLYLAFILAGWLAALAAPPGRRALRPSVRRLAWVLAAAGVVLLVVRLEAALRRPVPPGYEAGFHRWERQPDGTSARWTGGRAALTARVEGRVLVLPLRAPIPGLAARPQVVTVWVDGLPVGTVRLAAPDWEPLAVPVARPPGTHVLLELETAYTFVPARLGASSDTRRLGVMVGPLAWRDS
jgi:O-antigen ligase